MDWTLASKVTLNDGHGMPVLGLGVYRAAAGGEALAAVRHALAVGYRHIDTASLYGNEQDVGQAVRESGLPRGEVFVTTKVWNDDHGYENALQACKRSLAALGLDYIDLYLIHWPVEGLRGETWRALVKLRQEGLCRSIGVSNYTIRHLQELLASSDVVPAVNQVEFSPFRFDQPLLEFGRAKGIQLEAYSPLTKGRRLHDVRLAAVAAKYKKSVAQLLIRWCLEHAAVVIPKSTHPGRIAENAAVFDFAIDPADMRVLDALDEHLATGWDPSMAP